MKKFPWLIAVSTKKTFSGNNSTREEELICLRETLKISSYPSIVGQQVHQTNVAVVNEVYEPYSHNIVPNTDAIISASPGHLVSIMTADCVPLIIVSENPKMVGVVHAGWRGTLNKITEKTIHVTKRMGAGNSDIFVWLGPMALSCCYEVSYELIESFRKSFPELEQNKISSERNLNLYEINKHQLLTSGIPMENISSCQICTIHNGDTYHSYRVENGNQGRIITAVAISDQS